VTDPHDNSIPVLNEILVPGRARETREESGTADAPAARPAEPTMAPEPVLAPQPVPTPEQLSSPAPVLVPEPLAQSGVHQPHVADHTHARKQARPHHGVRSRHGHEDVHDEAHDEVHEETPVSPGVFDRAEPFIPLEAGATVPPDLGHEGAHEAHQELTPAPQPALDADAIAQRLHGRFRGFLTGEGQGIIEARCRDAVQQHTSLLVSQITREVAQTLEAEMTDWVREAVEEEVARHSRR
jgi:hypothetical protein